MPNLTTRRAILAGSAAAALGLAAAITPAEAGGSLTLTEPTDVVITPLATGASSVALIFDLNGWPENWTYIVRHFCPPGVEMHSQGFAILNIPGQTSSAAPRHTTVLENARNLIGANGEQGFSWYLHNSGDAAGPVRLEISFVARRVTP